jgi:hypothetical protein
MYDRILLKVKRDPDFKRKLSVFYNPLAANDPMADQFALEYQLALLTGNMPPDADRLRKLWSELDDDYE